MPNYPGSSAAKLLRVNIQKFAWQNETVAAATASLAFQLERIRSGTGDYHFGVSAALSFSGTPGAFEVVIQTADVDVETSYVTISTITAVNSNNAARVELTTLWAKYIRAKVNSLTNVVNTTVLFTR